LQISGINVVIYFAPTILADAGFTRGPAIFLSAGVAVGQLLAMGVLAGLVDRVGRRPMCFIGIAGMLVGLSVMGISFEPLSSTSTWDSSKKWLAVGGMLLFRVTFSLSLGPLPYIITSEIFAEGARAKGVSLSWGSNWISNFVVTLTFPTLQILLGASATFYL
jgi:MFS family permease